MIYYTPEGYETKVGINFSITKKYFRIMLRSPNQIWGIRLIWYHDIKENA